jgi:dTDP-4-dehydrorhamnose 3,5-epimerase
MKIIETSLPGVLILEPKVFGDERGFFVETYREQVFAEAGLNLTFVQDNQSRSRRGVLRGLHYQLQQPQGKLVRAARGRVFDVAVDVRRGSPTFGQWFGAILDDESHRQMYIPPGFAHGFVVLSEVADFIYKCTDYYHPQSENGIRWDDPDVAIEWPREILEKIILSERDRQLSFFRGLASECLPEFNGLHHL